MLCFEFGTKRVLITQCFSTDTVQSTAQQQCFFLINTTQQVGQECARGWEWKQLGQLTWTDQRNALYNVTSLSVIKTEGLGAWSCRSPWLETGQALVARERAAGWVLSCWLLSTHHRLLQLLGSRIVSCIFHCQLSISRYPRSEDRTQEWLRKEHTLWK